MDVLRLEATVKSPLQLGVCIRDNVKDFYLRGRASLKVADAFRDIARRGMTDLDSSVTLQEVDLDALPYRRRGRTASERDTLLKQGSTVCV